MTITFLEFVKPTMMPGGGMAGEGENIGFDSVLQASFIASVLASGAVVAGSAPGAFVPLPTTRIKFTGARGSIFVGGNPPLYAAGEIATFLSPISAALIASGDAVAN